MNYPEVGWEVVHVQFAFMLGLACGFISFYLLYMAVQKNKIKKKNEPI
jgi:hypothetical protein